MEVGRKYYDLSGDWEAGIEELGRFQAKLPGTLDTNGIGKAEKERIATRLTRLHTYEGEVRFGRRVKLPGEKGKRLFLEAERARQLGLEIDGVAIEACVPGTLSTPYVFEVTEYAGREVYLELISDNRYEGWSRKSIEGASAATDETQTNWNGILGYLRLREENDIFVEAVRAYPRQGKLLVTIECSGLGEKDWNIEISSPAIDGCVRRKADNIVTAELPIKEDAKLWEEGEGNCYPLTVRLLCGEDAVSEKTITFGIRDFGINSDLRLTLNERVFFLRGEANCCVFPEKGHPPMTVEEWKRVLSVYESYGVNCMRFHSWCPPEAAFTAADEMGMLMQPELSHWNCKDALEDEESFSYYEMELRSILRCYANHPSFVMLTLGNELKTAEAGHRNMDRLLRMAKELDNTRLYANSSNGHYGEIGTDKESDFYTSSGYYKEMLRATSSPMIGHLNQEYPGASHNYSETAKKVHRDGKPVFGFEVGQYEVLPDFKEIKEFQGVTRGINLEIIRENVEKAGRLEDWERYVEATGELALLCYREEVEAVLRTPEMSGLSLLGLQDFPGQGTAIVGMLNSHLEAKPYDFARPERFRQFFASVLPLLLLPKYTYEKGEILKAEVKLANYGRKAVKGNAGWRLVQQGAFDAEESEPMRNAGADGIKSAKDGTDRRVLLSGSFGEVVCDNQGLYTVGEIVIDCGQVDVPARLDVEIYVGQYKNTYPVWIYPGLSELKMPAEGSRFWYPVPEVLIVTRVTKEVLERVAAGASAYLEPEPVKERLPRSIGGQFSTDFWSVGTFPEQEGGMGLVIDNQHPVFRGFPTRQYSEWQWWQQASGRPLILPEHIHPIVTVPDSYSRLKHMGLLLEAKLGQGRVMISGMGLCGKQQYPETKALLHSILEYMSSGQFRPEQELTMEEAEQLFA